MLMAIRGEFRCRSLGLSYDFPHHFVKPQWNIRQSLFIAWRAFWFVWHLAWLIRSIQHEVSAEDYPGEGFKWFIYLTNWAYAVLFFHSGIYLAVVAYYTSKGKTDAEHFKDERAGWPMWVLWFLSNIAFDGAIIVTILYWSLVFKRLNHELSVMTHGVNSLYVLMDIFLVASPVRLLHVVYSCGFAAVYIIFSVFYHLADGTNSKSKPYIYSALDWTKAGTTTGVAIGVIFVAVPLAHLFQYALYTIRLHMAETCCKGGEVSQSSQDKEEEAQGQADVEFGKDVREKF